jgi:glucose/mannose transport system substrate-binding protein
MATDEASKDAIVAELHRFFTDERVSPADAQRRLGLIFKALPPRSSPQQNP